MRIFWLFCALGALLGCRTVSEPSGTAIALFCSTYQGAKTESLTVGEEVAVFAGPEGTEDYFLEAAQFIVGSDGRSLTYGSTVYYPDPKQAVRFLAYFPYHKGTFSVPTDQSTAKALKEADLCGAVARTTPVATPVALEFRHLMARLVVSANQAISGVLAYNVFSGGSLDVQTGTFIATTRSSLSTSGTELILPAQTVTRLVLNVAGIDYTFDGSVAVEVGRTTTLDLTLHPDTHTATLSGSSIVDWDSANGAGNPSHAVSNVLTLHWPTLPQGATPDQVVFTIGRTDYAVSNGITYANHTFTVPFASSVLRYPYTISNIAFYQSNRLVQSCANLIGATSYKSGTMTVGINPNAIRIGNLWWATGNLVASNATAGARGTGGCRIGAPADGGLYFQFGSLIGYKGGDQKNGGTGGGMPQAPLTTNGAYWNGVGFSWASDAMVWPTNLAGNPTSWPQDVTTNQWYFGLQTGWSTAGQNIRDFLNFSTGGLANVGVGDPCSYYLGGTWRLPTAEEYKTLCNNQGGYGKIFDWVAVGGSWTTSPVAGGNLAENNLFFPQSGTRDPVSGSFYDVTTGGYGLSSSVYDAEAGLNLLFYSHWVYPQDASRRFFGFPVRCVSE